MKLGRVQYQGERWLGQVQGEFVDLLVRIEPDVPEFGGAWIEDWLRQQQAGVVLEPQHRIPIDDPELKWLAPIPHPEKIICVGRNYAEHAAEMGSKIGDVPVIFGKFPNAIANPNDTIRLPEISHSVDFEAELVVIIGRTASHVSESDARDYIFGYCCGNDVSARDWQKGKPGGQWLLGKSFDRFAPIGPWIVTGDEIDPENLDISLKLNGKTMQSDSTSNLIFGINYLIMHLSRFFTLLPGDLLFTGTPSGVGAGRTPPLFLSPGDETVVEISGIGKLRNHFSAAEVS